MNFRDLPKPLLERLERIYTKEGRQKLFEVWSQPRITSLRVNTLKKDKESFLKEAVSENITLRPIEWYKDAFLLESPTLRDFSETPLYSNGDCYVQSLSSMVPALVMGPQKNEKILDLCAAPGSKTSQIAMMMENTGEIVANDSSPVRIYRLEANLKRLGVTNVRVKRGVGQGLWHDFPEYFDKTLVDVPCSMEGRISLLDPDSYVDWSTKKIKELQEIQKFLLRSAISATKVGGTIVYSTCTLAPEENESVIDWILKKEKGSVELEDIPLSRVPFMNPVQSWNNKVYDATISKTKRILPSQEFEGFYLAKLKKTKNTIPQSLIH